MRSCWASHLGGCSNKISGEHFFSQSIFINDFLTVYGFDWCKENPKTVGLEGLKTKILCTEHNSKLSGLDAEAGKFMEVMREFERINSVRNNLKTDSPNLIKYYVKGKLLERWFLKTLINFSSLGSYPIGSEGMLNAKPSKRLVEIAYGNKEFKSKEGLYILMHKNIIRGGETYKVAPIYNSDKYVAGGVFDLRGIRFLLSIENISIFDFLVNHKESTNLVQISGNTPIHHLKNYEAFTKKGKLSQRIIFEW